MKILHVITSLQTGGAEKLMVDLLPRLKPMNHEVELCVFDGVETPFYEQIEAAGVVVHPLSIGESVYNPLHIFRLARLMNRFDIVHTHNTAPQLFAAIAHLLTPKPSLITTEHNTTNRRRDKWYLKHGDLWMYRRYKKIICISDQTCEKLVEYIGESTNIVTIYNGIDVSRFASAMPLLEKEPNIKTITMVSAFRPQKDHKTLIKAFSLLPNYYRLQLVGDGELKRDTEIYAKKLPCAERINFMGNRYDVPQIIKSSDVIVLSSHYEGFGLVIVEGMAAGIPCIASDVDGLHEIVNGYGILFPHEDYDALANAILNICNDKEYARKVADRCQERARQFDISMMAEKYNQVYAQIKL